MTVNQTAHCSAPRALQCRSRAPRSVLPPGLAGVRGAHGIMLLLARLLPLLLPHATRGTGIEDHQDQSWFQLIQDATSQHSHVLYPAEEQVVLLHAFAVFDGLRCPSSQNLPLDARFHLSIIAGRRL